MTDITPVLFGVWLPGKGWLRGADARAFADVHREVAGEVARRIGRGAKVYYVDNALVDLEETLLEAERAQALPFFARLHRLLKVR